MSDKHIDRRAFIRRSVMMAGAAGFASMPAAELFAAERKKPQAAVAADEGHPHFSFGENGSFKLMQITDTHYISGRPESERALLNLCEALDAEKPDLVVHTGDIIYGKPAKESLLEILTPISDRKVPFAVTLGNHDEEYGMSRREVMDLVRTLPYNINGPYKEIYGASNDIITLGGSAVRPERVFYIFDSNSYSRIKGIKGYDYIHHDQIDWYRSASERFTAANDGVPVPSMAFFHIPVPEFNYSLNSGVHRVMRGNLGEEPVTAKLNPGLFCQMKELGDIEAIVCGHDHDNDYAMRWQGIFLMFGRYSGCDTVYNDLKPNGVRVFEFAKGEAGWRSYVRIFGGKVDQDLRYPDAFATVL